MRRIAVVGLLVAFGSALSAARSEDAAPDLPIAEWQKAPLTLEDFKGQVTALVFFNDDAS